jgi:hypothetical protein
VELLLAQVARVPPIPPLLLRLAYQVVLLRLSEQNFCLPRQARHVRDTQFWRRNAVTISTRASTHKTFSRARMRSLETDVAFLPLGVLGARLDRDHDGLLVLVVGVVLFRVAAAVNYFTDLLVPAAPVVVLAGGIAVPGFAPHTMRPDSRGFVGGQWRGAGGAVCEDHI